MSALILSSVSPCRKSEHKSIVVHGTSLGYLIADVSPSSLPTMLDDLDIAKHFRRLSKWHFQTKPLTAEIASTNSPSRSGNRSSSIPKGSLMSRLAAPNAAQLVGASSQAPEVSAAADHERCTQQFARSAALILWFPSYPVVTGRCTAAIASVEWVLLTAANS